jgi:pimeloyl-ACP methyl ester carboxylesterase
VARIVLVHGAFNELWGPNELKARWLPAVRDGLWHHGVELHDDDVAVCFYGDLFRRHPGTDEDRQLQQSRAGVADALADLQGGDAMGALAQAASDATFDRTVDMVTVMTTAPNLRERLRARIEAVVGDDTRVLVAHSLGTVLSYTALANHPGWPVHTFVTLGSPLGAAMVFDTLEPAPVDGQGHWPGSVERWVNVRAVGDKAAAVSLVERFGPRVEEHLVDNGHRAHAPEPYLNCVVTGAAIAACLNAPGEPDEPG